LPPSTLVGHQMDLPRMPLITALGVAVAGVLRCKLEGVLQRDDQFLPALTQLLLLRGLKLLEAPRVPGVKLKKCS
jgi:hypothetical protein